MTRSSITQDGDKYVVPALQRGMQLLGQFTRNERELLRSRVARATCLDSSHVFIVVRSGNGVTGPSSARHVRPKLM